MQVGARGGDLKRAPEGQRWMIKFRVILLRLHGHTLGLKGKKLSAGREPLEK